MEELNCLREEIRRESYPSHSCNLVTKKKGQLKKKQKTNLTAEYGCENSK